MLLEKTVPKQEINVGQLTGPTTIEGIAMSRDTYNIPGQAGAVGPGAQARNNTFQQIQAGTMSSCSFGADLADWHQQRSACQPGSARPCAAPRGGA
jgi:hypothetical protein